MWIVDTAAYSQLMLGCLASYMLASIMLTIKEANANSLCSSPAVYDPEETTMSSQRAGPPCKVCFFP